MGDTLREHLRKAGRIGGKSTSRKKRRAARANLKRANAAKRRARKGGR